MSIIISKIRRHLIDTESDDRKIAISFFWVSLFVLIGKMAGAAKEVVIAQRFGTSETVDAYVFVMNLINWPISVWFSVLTVVLVPLVARVRKNNVGGETTFRSELLGLSLVLGIFLGLLAYYGMPLLLAATWTGLPDATLMAALNMSSGLALIGLLGAIISLFSVWMLADGHHRNTLFESIPSLCLLLILILPAGWIPDPLIWGSIAGFAFHLIALAFPLYKRRYLSRPRFELSSPIWKSFWSGIFIMAIGQFLMSFTAIVDQFFAVRLDAGSVSTLNYANRVVAMIMSLGAMAFSRSALPVFSELSASRQGRVKSLALRWTLVALASGCIFTGIFWIVAVDIIGLLFERGNFSEVDTLNVSIIFKYSVLQLPFYFSTLVLVALCSAIGSYRFLLYLGGLGLIVKVLTSLVLIPEWGLIGIVLSSSCVYLVNLILMLIKLKRL